ncbi:MAG: glycoside hydrolase family 16 protein [Acidobacteriaceae bacterium]|nr:glycoside hydrolase family 16 protein [Acidobacteriaceae bacterium]
MKNQSRSPRSLGSPAVILLGLAALIAGLASNLRAAEPVTFFDDFSSGKLDNNKWDIATYHSPDSKPGINQGTYVADAIDFATGMLRIKVTQQDKNGVVQSFGGAIISKNRFGYGTYEFVMRMSTTATKPDGEGKTLTGAISSGFLYYHNSESEIDLEFLGNENAMHVTNWLNPTPSHQPEGDVKQTDKINDDSLGSGFRNYKIVWLPDSIKVYVDEKLVASHDKRVPATPAHIILQHRGTNSDEWGGTASLGITRYFYVKSVKFTDLEPR